MYWCAAERFIRERAFDAFEKDQNSSPSEEHVGRLFTIACKQARLWLWESDYELDLDTPSSSIYNNGAHASVVENWARKQNVSAKVTSLLADYVKENDKGTRHPLRFLRPRLRYAIAVYLLSCNFLYDPKAIALLPPSVNLDMGYGISRFLSIIDDPDKVDDDASGEKGEVPGDLLGHITQLKRVWNRLNAIPGTGEEYDSIIKKARETIAEIFAIMGVVDIENVVFRIDKSLRTKVDPEKFQSVPQLSEELIVTKLPGGNVAVYLSKYFSVSEVLNPNFWKREAFNKLNLILIGHRSFHVGAFLPSAPVIRTQRKIKGTVKRGTVATLLAKPGDSTEVVPSDVFYASTPSLLSWRLENALVPLQLTVDESVFNPRDSEDELAMFSGQNILQTLLMSQSNPDVFARLFYNADQAVADESTDNDYYAAYADIFAFLHTYERRENLTQALMGFASAVNVDGPSFNNGSVVYPVVRSLTEQGTSVQSPLAESQTQYRVLTAYTAIDTSAISDKELEEVPLHEGIMNIRSDPDDRYYSEQKLLSQASSLASIMAESASSVCTRYTPMAKLTGVNWSDLPGNLGVIQGTMVLDPFVENRTGRTHQIFLNRSDISALFDPLSEPKSVKFVLPTKENDRGVVINSQWPWKERISVVQGRTPEPVVASPSLPLLNIDYVLNDERATLLFFAQARVRSDYKERSGFSWIVGRYLGVNGYGPHAKIPIMSSWFLAREEEIELIGDDDFFSVQGPDQWIPVDEFLPIVSVNETPTVPDSRVAFITK